MINKQSETAILSPLPKSYRIPGFAEVVLGSPGGGAVAPFAPTGCATACTVRAWICGYKSIACGPLTDFVER